MDIQGFWKAVIAQDADKIRTFFHPHAYVNWHNTNERFSVEEFIRANCEYPGKWKGKVESHSSPLTTCVVPIRWSSTTCAK